MNINRIATDYGVAALVAFDSFPLIAERIQRLTPVGRRLAVAHSYATYIARAPEVHHGLVVAQVRVNPDPASLWVECEPHFGFGVGIRDTWIAETEEKAWKHYHAGQHEAKAYSDRRHDLTWVSLRGGQAGAGLGRDDQIIIRTYNGDGVCDERVITFEDPR